MDVLEHARAVVRLGSDVVYLEAGEPDYIGEPDFDLLGPVRAAKMREAGCSIVGGHGR